MGILSHRTGAADWRSLPSAVATGTAVGAIAAGLLGTLAGLVDLTDGGADAAPMFLVGAVAVPSGALLARGVQRPRRHQAGDILTGLTAAFLAMVVVGAALYLATGTHRTVDDALFESAAGFTTTAMTIVDVEGLGRGVLLFRAASQWVGGLTALLLGIAILPALSVGRELADRRRGMGRRPLAPSGGVAARNVLRLYGAFTLLMAVGYLAAGVDVVGAVVLAASTVSTGGFVGPGQPLEDAAVQWVAIAGMVVAGASLVVVWRLLTRQWGGLRRAAEFRAYLLFLVVGSLLLAWWTDAAGWTDWRQALFTLVSAATTTGFPSDPLGAWAAVAPVFLLMAAAVGPMTGSTGGGFQIFRLLGLLRLAQRELMRQLHPSLVSRIRIGGLVLSEATVGRIVLQQFLFVAVVVGTTGAVATFGLDLATALAAGVHAAASAGPVRALDGTVLDPGAWSRPVRLALVPAMVVGRLALYPALLAAGTAATAVRDRLRLRRRIAARRAERVR